MPHDRLVDHLLADPVEVFRLVRRAEPLDAQPVRKNKIGLPPEQAPALVARDIADGRENVGAVAGRPFEPDARLNIEAPGILLPVEMREMVVKPAVRHCEVPPEHRGVGGEYHAERSAIPPQVRDRRSAQPLVEVRDHRRVRLRLVQQGPQELPDHVPEGKSEVDLFVIRNGNMVVLPEEILDFPQLVHHRLRVHQDDIRAACHKPAPIVDIVSAAPHGPGRLPENVVH